MNGQTIDILWLLISAILVLLMQAGFLCLESGVTRSKNAINVAMKNAADFFITFFIFWLCGFGLMFGDSTNGWIGGSHFLLDIGQGSAWEAAFFIFQSMFCATAATIVSGAIAERVRFRAYLLITLIIVALIYPVSGHWAWGGAMTGTLGWLAELGFIDFAGSTVVHSVGGWVALAAVLIVGPRSGRFKHGEVQVIPGSNPTLALIGALIFVIGWTGFNGGSTLELNETVPGIIANTILAATAGAIAAYLFYALNPEKYVDHLLIPINGAIAGLVSITASVHAVSAGETIIIASLGSALMLAIDKWMIRKGLDDAIGAVPVHLGAGIWGTLCVALFGDLEILQTGLSRSEQLLVQIQGILVIGLWSFLIAFVLLYTINRLNPLRVSHEDEEIGLNVSEHGAKTELIELLSAMREQEHSTDLSRRVPVEPFTEVGQIAAQHNRVMDALEQAVEQTQAIIRDIRDGILTFGKDGVITSFNPGAEQIFNINGQAIIGQHFSSLLHPDEPALSICRKQNNIQDACIALNQKKELLGLRADKDPFHMEVTISKGNLSQQEQYTASIRDISEKRIIEDQLFQEKERALVTLESIADGVITTNKQGKIEYLNAAAELFTGWTLADATGQAFSEVYQAHDEISGQQLGSILDQPLNQNLPISDSGTYNVHSRHGDQHTVQHTAAPIKNRNGRIMGAVVVFHDVTAARAMQKQLSHQATHDSLTGLMNRSEFEKQAAELITHASSGNEEHVLCYLDLDQFKLVNDTCGHIAGDELLRQVAQLIAGELRSGDSIARLGGDEFGILLRSCPIEQGVLACENIREAIKDFRFPWEEKQFSIGVSIGVVKIDAETQNLSQLLSWADTACYAAKDLGRNRVHVYEPEDIELAKRQGQMQWVSRIRQALDRDQFRLYFQTIAPTASTKNRGGHYEIFIRMIDENEGIIPPGAFIPAAERYNLMQEIDLWVVKNALAWMGDHSRQGKNPVELCALNLSGASIGDPACLSAIKNYFRRYDVQPELVCFEITETAAIANLRSATKFIKDLKAIGCRFALDDFGSGLSSFGYLKNLKVDYLKIDGSFIKDIDRDTTDLAMVQSINSIGHVMGLKTIAEFVESETILETLRDIGVDYVQGHHIDRPRPLEQLDGVTFMPR